MGHPADFYRPEYSYSCSVIRPFPLNKEFYGFFCCRLCHMKCLVFITLVFDRGFDFCDYLRVHDIIIVITYSKSKDQPGKVANPARG